MARIGFIGTGEIAEAMVRGLAGQGHDIYVSERTAARADALAAEFSDVSVANNQSVLDASDYVCLCLMRDVALEILPKLSFRADHKVISAMVDVDMKTLSSLCSPATKIDITIPMPFIATAQCPLPVYPDAGVVEDIFADRHIILPVTSEQALNAHFAASALSSAIFMQMQAGSEWLGDVAGDKAAAEAYVVALFSGFLDGMPADGQGRFAEALSSLSTEGGLNATLRAHMADASVPDTLRAGLDALKPRLGLSS